MIYSGSHEESRPYIILNGKKIYFNDTPWASSDRQFQARVGDSIRTQTSGGRHFTFWADQRKDNR